MATLSNDYDQNVTNHNIQNLEFDDHGVTINEHQHRSYQAELKQQNKQRNFSTLMRLFGACAVIASMSLFLIEGWTDGNDLSRFLKLLAQTGLITGAGIFLSSVVKEAKGARVFFGLGLLSAVANFTILGALTYSVFQFDNGLTDYAPMLQWQAVSLTKLLPLAIGGIALMALLARFSFSIFARNAAGQLTVTFLALNFLLLIPAREALYVSVIAAIALLVATKTALKMAKGKVLPMTAEAKFALASLFVPGLIIVCRALGLYAVNDLVLLTLFSVSYYALRSANLLTTNITAIKLLGIGQLFAAIGAAFSLAAIMPHSLEWLSLLAFSCSITAAIADYLTQQLKHNEGQINLPLLVLLLTLGLMIMNIAYSLTSFTFALKAAAVVNMGILFAMFTYLRTKAPQTSDSQVLAAIGLAITTAMFVIKTVSLLNVGMWAVVGGIGIALILLGSLYERYGLRIKLPAGQRAL